MSNRVSFASLNLKITEDYKAELQMAPDSTLSRFRNAAVQGYKTMAESVLDLTLFLLAYGATWLLWGALLFFPARLL